MFGHQGGESAETVARKQKYGLEAQERWRFLTKFDLSTIKNKKQLCSIIHIRSGVSDLQAEHDVTAWMIGKEF